MKKIMLVFGTRPEAIKMCPLVKVLKTLSWCDVKVCVTGQHRQMLDQVLQAFSVVADYDLSIMKNAQTLFDITAAVLHAFPPVLLREKPDMVLVHGDTTTSFAAALACYYLQIPVGHVEAGLRTGDIYAPFPEEFNRQAVSLTAALHFAPTSVAKENLLREGKKAEHIFVTGNTIVDALNTTLLPNYSHPLLTWAQGSRLILLTAHRRENWGKKMTHIFRAVRQIADEFENVKVLYPVHPNPQVTALAQQYLTGQERICLTAPLGVVDFHNIMSRSEFILTDSGGIQEEACALAKPVLVLRDTTERPEGVNSGILRLAGTSQEKIYLACKELLSEPSLLRRMSTSVNPYGDGHACEKIAQLLKQYLS
ncbi:MAG: UDP-N-acetylglucosamine 2-epimerase (non-hydrolyzing) [Elusimicrobiaceae bacterium]|nr:UDP-N-acetylglucosamine 2-epimerase (non-hydrolyzing) [Elusimicrobiaceae bacterium]